MSLLRFESSFFKQLQEITIPFTDSTLNTLKAGDLVSLNGMVYTGRDETHRRLAALLDAGRPLPVDLRGAFLYYVGPSPPRPGRVIGAAGPTTSYRMDPHTPRLLELGLTATMGKGQRSREVREAMQRHGAIYLASIGGAGALLSQRITSCELVAFEDAGPEALFRMELASFPAVVINDRQGNDYYDIVKSISSRGRACHKIS